MIPHLSVLTTRKQYVNKLTQRFQDLFRRRMPFQGKKDYSVSIAPRILSSLNQQRESTHPTTHTIILEVPTASLDHSCTPPPNQYLPLSETLIYIYLQLLETTAELALKGSLKYDHPDRKGHTHLASKCFIATELFLSFGLAKFSLE